MAPIELSSIALDNAADLVFEYQFLIIAISAALAFVTPVYILLIISIDIPHKFGSLSVMF